MKYQAVIFDMDGLLLDTELLYIELCEELTAELGYPLPREAFIKCIGRDDRDSAVVFRSYAGEDFPAEYVRTEMVGRIQRAIEMRGAPTKPGATEILTRLHEAGIPTSIATSTYRDSAEFRIASAGWTGLFDTFTFGNEVKVGKPAPDVFLLAASRLGAEPSRCVVLEDSFNGLRAARAAGMTSVWVPDLLTAQTNPEIVPYADHIVKDLYEACELLFAE